MPMRKVKATNQHIRLLAQLMQAEARGEGRRGQELVGSVLINRVVADCKPDFHNIRNIPHAVYGKFGPSRSPFEPVQNGEIYKMRPSSQDIRRARDLANGRVDSMARRSLWFFNPSPGQRYRAPCTPKMPRSPKTQFEYAYKNHCFYTGVPGYCQQFL
ncbi:cell wall hydrolase [Tumebacillus lipolyticus]|uniref:Cell wall hydrolase n=1 Tax=Tumebacillus lipolyticus TaxID=1280370 RepID=A0ABW4ZTR3_9BACL